MTVRRFLQLDVFAPYAGAGNPLAVVLDAADLDTARMQAFAAWTNLSETVFFLPPTAPEADYRIRIFTPRMELPFAGHPSVGAAWAALEAGLARGRDGGLVQECAAGLLPVRIARQDGRIVPTVRSPRAQRREAAAPDWLLAPEVFGARRGALPPALWNNGPGWWLLELADAAAVRGLRPDLARSPPCPARASWRCSRRATVRPTWWCAPSHPAPASPRTRPPAASMRPSPPPCTRPGACPAATAATAPARAASWAATRCCSWRWTARARSGSVDRCTR